MIPKSTACNRIQLFVRKFIANRFGDREHILGGLQFFTCSCCSGVRSSIFMLASLASITVVPCILRANDVNNSLADLAGGAVSSEHVVVSVRHC